MGLKFTYPYLKSELESAIEQGYRFIRCIDYFHSRKPLNKVIVLRIDVDFSVKKVRPLLEIFDRLGIKATFFIRLHAPEYNPFDFSNYLVIKDLLREGHELGYHSEIVDQEKIWNEPASENLKRDIVVIEKMFNTKIYGVASHGGMTGFNNLDFWKNKAPEDYGLLYEAYDDKSFNLFAKSRYISDSEWVQWKAYEKGTILDNDRRSLSGHLEDSPQLIYLLIHSDTYYNHHFYE